MIGKIKGTLAEVEGNAGLIATAGGVYYQVFLPPTIATGIMLNQPIEIYTYLQVREDAQVLYGFENKKQYQLFKMLLTVDGVGPKSAFSVISFTTVDDLYQAIKDNNIDYITRVPGLGKKTAMKIMLELSQKLQSEFKMEKMYLSDEEKTVIDALVSLGFKSQEAKNILSQLPKDLTLEQKIQQGIKLATSK